MPRLTLPRFTLPDPRTLLRRLAFAVVGLVVLGFALIGVLDATRGTPLRYVLTLDGALDSAGLPAVRDSLFTRTMQLYTGMNLEPGNDVEMLLDGDGTYPPFWRDLRGARRSITAQFYYSQEGAVADTLAAILLERHRAGVQVLVLLDAFGSGPLKERWVPRLRAAGIRVAWMRPLHWYTINRANERSHVRAIVVDGAVGYTGGFGLADYWLGDGTSPDEWRETNVRVEGRTVAQLQAAFAVGWVEATGMLLTGDDFFPPPAFAPAGRQAAGVLLTSPTVGSTTAERFMALSIVGARERLWISNSYFVPDDDFRRLLVRASERGVDVRLMLSGPETDVRTTLHAARYRYEELLRGGVRIFEYQPSNMHAKSFVVDGIWSSIGTMNFDNRSMAFNNEIMVAALDTTLGAQMEAAFEKDMRHAREITIAEVQARDWRQRLAAWGSHLLSRVL